MTDPQTPRHKAPADAFTEEHPDLPFQAVMVVSFGGPEGMDDVIPFMENVTAGRGIPKERLEEVSEHYKLFDGVSPINDQNRAIIAALRDEMDAHGMADIPIYWGNRNWHPFITDTVQQMADDGIKKALAFLTSGFSCWSGCRQYREDLYNAQQAVGEGAPEFMITRKFYNHPGWVAANVAQLREALADLPTEEDVHIAFTAHSIPLSQANNSDYVIQLETSCRLVADELGISDWELVYQSRSGPPHIPWLEPDINDHLEAVAERGVKRVAIAPIGFISDHMEVMFDLDIEAKDTCEALGITMVRAASAGTHPRFIQMVRELIEERIKGLETRPYLGSRGPGWDVCPTNCCLQGGRGKPSPWVQQHDDADTPARGGPPTSR
jgi:ferrochelatase